MQRAGGVANGANGAGINAVVFQADQFGSHDHDAAPGESARQIHQAWLIDAEAMNAVSEHESGRTA